jgi:hypothetical protein
MASQLVAQNKAKCLMVEYRQNKAAEGVVKNYYGFFYFVTASTSRSGFLFHLLRINAFLNRYSGCPGASSQHSWRQGNNFWKQRLMLMQSIAMDSLFGRLSRKQHSQLVAYMRVAKSV